MLKMSINVCEECESLKKCKDGYILSNDDCVSCFSIKEGCEECFQNTICYKCYDNNIFKYSLNNGLKNTDFVFIYYLLLIYHYYCL